MGDILALAACSAQLPPTLVHKPPTILARPSILLSSSFGLIPPASWIYFESPLETKLNWSTAPWDHFHGFILQQKLQPIDYWCHHSRTLTPVILATPPLSMKLVCAQSAWCQSTRNSHEIHKASNLSQNCLGFRQRNPNCSPCCTQIGLANVGDPILGVRVVELTQ